MPIHRRTARFLLWSKINEWNKRNHRIAKRTRKNDSPVFKNPIRNMIELLSSEQHVHGMISWRWLLSRAHFSLHFFDNAFWMLYCLFQVTWGKSNSFHLLCSTNLHCDSKKIRLTKWPARFQVFLDTLLDNLTFVTLWLFDHLTP